MPTNYTYYEHTPKCEWHDYAGYLQSLIPFRHFVRPSSPPDTSWQIYPATRYSGLRSWSVTNNERLFCLSFSYHLLLFNGGYTIQE